MAMTHTYSSHLKAAAVLAVVLTLTACGSGRSKDTGAAPTPPPVAVTRQEDTFGTVFGNLFRATANSEPSSVNDGDLVAVSFTTEPTTIN